MEKVTIRLTTHRNVREHTTIRLELDRSLLETRLWMKEDGTPTKKLYDWAVKHGSMMDCDYSDFPNNDDDDLAMEADLIPAVPAGLGAVVETATGAMHFRVRATTPPVEDRSTWVNEAGVTRSDRDIHEYLVYGGKVLSEGLPAPVSGNGGEQS